MKNLASLIFICLVVVLGTGCAGTSWQTDWTTKVPTSYGTKTEMANAGAQYVQFKQVDPVRSTEFKTETHWNNNTKTETTYPVNQGYVYGTGYTSVSGGVPAYVPTHTAGNVTVSGGAYSGLVYPTVPTVGMGMSLGTGFQTQPIGSVGGGTQPIGSVGAGTRPLR